MTRQAESSATCVAAAVPLLGRAIPLIGHFQIRNRGTVGGSIAHADPAAELPAVALALGRRLESRRLRQPDVAAVGFFVGTWTTSLGPDELLTAVRFPVWPGRCGFAVDEVARRHGDFALAGVACGVGWTPTAGRRGAIALFGLGVTPVRARPPRPRSSAGAVADDLDESAGSRCRPRPADRHPRDGGVPPAVGAHVVRARPRRRAGRAAA